MTELKPGLTHDMTIVVTDDMAASRYVKGTPDVFATAAMLALIEHTAYDLIQPYLEEGQTTVGTHINASHIAATPLGMKVTAKVRLEEVDRRRLEFSVEVFDEVEKISDAKHTRFIIDKAKFDARTQEKSEKA